MPDQYGYSTPDEVLAYRQDALASQGYSGVNDGSGNFYTQDYYDAGPAALAANAQNTAATNASGMFGGVQNSTAQDAQRKTAGMNPGDYMNPYLSSMSGKMDQYGGQIKSINDTLGQYGNQFGQLSSQLTGMQTAQKDYYSQQQAAQQARQQQYQDSLKNYGDALTKQSTQNFTQSVMPQLRSGAQAAGQYGGSRQGIAEGVAAGNASTGLGANLASLYSQGYGANVNAGLQQQSLDNNYNLGLGGLANSNQAQNQNFYTQNRSLDQSGLSLGNQLYNSGVNGQLNLGNAQYNAGNIYQNAPLTTLQNYGNTISPYTGLNSSQVNTGSSGGGATGTLGGILAGLGITKNLGF
jgi:hypothetical protein